MQGFGDYRVLPVEQIVFSSATVRAGAFRCPPHDPLFRNSGPIQHPTFVFPRTAVRIRHAGQPAFTASPNLVTLYNQGDEYEREEARKGMADRCDWMSVDPSLLREVGRAFEPSIDDRPEAAPFSSAWTASSAALYLAQRSFFARVAHGELDRLEAEELAVEILTLLFQSIAGRAMAVSPPSPRDRTLVEETRRILAAHPERNVSLARLAASVGASRFHLCRIFSRACGVSPHEFRQQLRLRLALERLADGTDDILTIALDLGFSSHSHFTEAFRRRFHLTPSRFRQSCRGGSGPPIEPLAHALGRGTKNPQADLASF